jgi:prepilin-type processing-associated H-X9-DG protein
VFGGLALLGALLLPALARPKSCHLFRCINNLKQVGLAFRIYANDHGDQFPWSVSTNQGGSAEFTNSGGNVAHFAIASNELNTPKILSCSFDSRRTPTRDWNLLSRSNISYFVSFDADENFPHRFLSGDRNIIGGFSRSGIRLLATNSTVLWSTQIHSNSGNVAFADGSAQLISSAGLQGHVFSNDLPVMRLSLP